MKDMNIETIKSVYFIGAGGIGMSALIRYFLSKGKKVAGYDRTSSELTERLEYRYTTKRISTLFRRCAKTRQARSWSIPPPCRKSMQN